MQAPLSRILRFVSLAILTLAALVVMVVVVARRDPPADSSLAEPSEAALRRSVAMVSVERVEPEEIEIVDTFAGKIRPWESYSIGFEVAGRVKELGTNQAGQMLDDGDAVRAGQVLARLDDRMFKARKNEAAAELERARSNLRRARDLRDRGVGGISETEYLDRLTEESTAEAALEIATKNLDDSVLSSPVDAVIDRRFIKPGESVQPNTTVFELVELDPVLLVLDVPESRVREIEEKVRQVERNRRLKDGVAVEEHDLDFRVYVDLESESRFGKSWPTLIGSVHHVAETADPHTGLFEVEVRLENPEGLLKPGMVALGKLVTDRMRGYRIPATSLLFRHNKATIFIVEEEPVEVEAMFWKVGQGAVRRARRLSLERFIEQGPDCIVPADGEQIHTVVVRGQHRLVDGQLVQIVPMDEPEQENYERSLHMQTPATARAED